MELSEKYLKLLGYAVSSAIFVEQDERRRAELTRLMEDLNDLMLKE